MATFQELRNTAITSLINSPRKEKKGDYVFSESRNQYQLFLWSEKDKGHLQVFDKRVTYKELMSKLLENY